MDPIENGEQVEDSGAPPADAVIGEEELEISANEDGEEDTGSGEPEGAGGETPTPEQVAEWRKAHENMSNWQKSLTQKSQEVAEQKREMERLRKSQQDAEELAVFEETLNYENPDEAEAKRENFKLSRELQRLRDEAAQSKVTAQISQTETEINSAVDEAVKSAKIDARFRDKVLKELKHDYYFVAAPAGNASIFDFKKEAANIAKTYRIGNAALAGPAPIIQKSGGSPNISQKGKEELSDDAIAKKWFNMK